MKKVLLISIPAIATTILTERIIAAAKKQGASIELTTLPEAEGLARINEFDVLLLPPYLRYLLNRRKNLGAKRELVVKVIDSVPFGSLDGEAVLKVAMDAA